MSPLLRLPVALALLVLLGETSFAAKGPQPTICQRSCWSARSASCSSTIGALTRAIIHHTAGSTDYTTDYESAKARMRATQNYHMDSRGYCDIAYHFLVSAGGHIFEGRVGAMSGMTKGAHDGCNSDSFGFTALGYFHSPYNHTYTAALQDSLYDVIAWRMPSAWSPYGSGSYCSATVGTLDGHRKVKATACPGDIIWTHIGSNYNGGNARNGVYERKNPPTAPSNLQATSVSSSQINLSWNDNSSTETGFRIERAGASSGPWTQVTTVAANVKTYSNTGLNGNTLYYYRVRAYNSLGDSANSNTASAATQGLGPTITAQPQSQTKNPGVNVTFSVTATGSGTLTYQWRKNGANLSNGDRISGATTATLSISTVQSSDAGAYSVRVTDSLGTTTSADATLYLNAVIIFEETFESGNLNNWTTISNVLTISPTNHTSGGSKSAQVDSSSDKMFRDIGFELQGKARATFWMYDNMGTQTRWYGEVRAYTGAGYNLGTLEQLFAIGRYSVGFGTTGTGTLAGEVVQTNRYQARVVYGANTGWMNLNATRSAGWHKFEIERAANGTTINFYVDGVLDRSIPGATYATWDTVTIGSLGSGTSAGSAWFDDIKLEYFDPPSIITQPAGVTVNAGGNATFSVVATNNVESYRWRFEGVNIAGATASSYTRADVDSADAGNYSVLVMNRAGTVTSVNAPLVVNVPPTITEHPEDTSTFIGRTASFSVEASGTGPLGFQWRFNNTDLPGKTGQMLTIEGVTTNHSGSYSVTVTNSTGSVTSNPAQLTVTPPPPPELSDVVFDGSALQYTLFGEPGTQYVIESSEDLANWTVVTNVILSDASMDFVHPVITNQPARFYRGYQQ